jgi:flagellar motor component MotA
MDMAVFKIIGIMTIVGLVVMGTEALTGYNLEAIAKVSALFVGGYYGIKS